MFENPYLYSPPVETNLYTHTHTHTHTNTHIYIYIDPLYPTQVFGGGGRDARDPHLDFAAPEDRARGPHVPQQHRRPPGTLTGVASVLRRS